MSADVIDLTARLRALRPSTEGVEVLEYSCIYLSGATAEQFGLALHAIGFRMRSEYGAHIVEPIPSTTKEPA